MFDYARKNTIHNFMYLGRWCLESYNFKEQIGSNNPRKNGAQGLDNAWRNCTWESYTPYKKENCIGVKQL